MRTPRLSPNSFIIMQFSTQILQNNRLAHPHPSGVGAPLGNPGSATGFTPVLSETY